MDRPNWRIVDRPGYSGADRERLHAFWNETYGEDRWRIAWRWGEEIIDREEVYQLYEDAYFMDSFLNPEKWDKLIKEAREVYDIEERDVLSGRNYLDQRGNATHLQDVAVRRVLFRRGWNFEGDKLVRIRKHEDEFGALFSPAKISFHIPEKVVSPYLKGWWNDPVSVEGFYQNNKVLQARIGDDYPL